VAALDNPRFRTILLVVAGAPISVLYLWRTVVLPLLVGAVPGDIRDNYILAASRIAAGLDPYTTTVPAGGFVPLPLAGPQYVTPPPVAWMLQPLVHAGAEVQLIAVLAVLHLSLIVFLLTALRALRVTSWQMALLLVLVAIAFEPVAGNFDEGQVNLVLLGLSGVWLLGWVAGDRWWAGAALGAAVAMKLLQAPAGLLVLWGRRWRMALGAVLGGGVLWLVAVPQYLPEYLIKVAPALSAGTGLFENHSPGGTVMRLLDPNTFLGASRDTPAAARAITLAISLAVLVVTFVVLRRPSERRTGRALEAAAIVAAGPLIATYSWGTHLVLLLLPMLVLVEWAVRRRDWTVLALVAAGWMLIGPAHNLFQSLLVSGYSNLAVLRVMAEFGVAGISAIWIGTLVAVRRERSADRADAAHEHGAEEQQHDRAREHHAISEVG
jgi:Glycosyltransferase family 87